MNVREELYRSGSTMTIRYVYSRRGQRVAVIDPHLRTRAAIVTMLKEGKRPRAIARSLDMPLHLVCEIGLAALTHNRWNFSNSILR